MRVVPLRSFIQGVKWNVIFLFMVVFIIFIIPVAPIAWQNYLYDVSYTFLLILGYLSTERKRRWFIPVAITAVIMVWVSTIFRFTLLFWISSIVNIYFFAFVVLSMVVHLARSKTVTSRLIIEAVIIYLLIGLIYALIISMVAGYDPSAFSFPALTPGESEFHDRTSEYIYFAFTCLTTTGFGDVTPREPYSRSITILMGITGQMYIAIIIAMLVGKFAAQVKIDENE